MFELNLWEVTSQFHFIAT